MSSAVSAKAALLLEAIVFCWAWVLVANGCLFVDYTKMIIDSFGPCS